MSKRSLIRLPFLLKPALFCALLAAPAFAAPISFVYSGIGSGTLAGSSFTDRRFTVTFSGDTSNIRRHPVNPDITELPISSTTIFIVGFPTTSVSDSVIMSVGPLGPSPSWQLYPQTEPPGAGQVFLSISPDYVGWNMATPLPPHPFFLFGGGIGSSYMTTAGPVTVLAVTDGVVAVSLERGCGQPFTAFREASAKACVGTASASCDIARLDDVTLSGVASVDATIGSTAARLAVNARANSSYGILSSGSDQSFRVQGVPAVAYGAARGEFQDLMRVDFPPFNGSSGIMFVDYTLTGTVTDSGASRSFADVGVAVCGPFLPTQFISRVHSTSTSGAFRAARTFNFIYGQWFALDFRLDTSSGTFTDRFDLTPRLGMGRGRADFFNTLMLSRFELFDSLMNPVTGVTFTSASGTPYTERGVGLPVSIVIKPGDDLPAINPRGRGRTTVAVLSNAAFGADAIDTASLAFGRLGVEHSLDSCGPLEDMNGDGLADLVCHFKTALTGFQAGDSEGVLRGRTVEGTPFVGTDEIRVIQQ